MGLANGDLTGELERVNRAMPIKKSHYIHFTETPAHPRQALYQLDFCKKRSTPAT